jgi:cytochrome c-type biogenesis protein CcmF
MTPVTGTVWLAAAATTLALLASAASHAWPRFRPAARRLPTAAAAATGLSLLVLVWAFLRGDLSVFYVWENVDRSYPWWLRVAGVWGGQAGTFLLWSGVIATATAFETHRATGRAWRRARTVLLLVATVLLVAPIALHLGAETALYGLTAEEGFQLGASGPSPTSLRPAGDGLNPLLESPYMSIHPVVEFLAYGLTAIPFAYGLVHLFTGETTRQRARPWARAAWLSFLAALTLGGLWAYNVLSFGGYWIWDPVEVANLLPFLALTVYLHAAPVNRRGWLGLLTPSSAVLAFVLVLFGSFVTRTGLWSSVHAFLPVGLSVAIEDPMQRLAAAVEAGFQPAFATRLFALGLGAATSAMAAFHARETDEDGRWWGVGAGVYAAIGLAGLLAPTQTVQVLAATAGALSFGRPLVGVMLVVAVAAVPLAYGLLRSPEDTPVSARTRGGQLTLAAALLALIAVASGLLLVLGVNGYRADVYWARAPYLGAAVLGLVGLAFHPGEWSTRLVYVGGGLGVGLLARFLTGSWAWAAVPVGLVTLGALGVVYLRRATPQGDRRARWRAGLLGGAGLLGLVQWAWPGAVTVAGLSLASPPGYLVIGLTASLGAIVAPFVETRGRAGRWVGPALGVLAVGYGLGALAALLAGLVDRRSTGQGSLATVGVPLIHAGLAVLVLGVALSTYGASTWTFDQGEPLVRGQPADVGAHEVELVDGALEDGDGDGRTDRVSATVHVTRGEGFVAEETLALSYSPSTGLAGQGSFVPEGSPSARAWWGDVALNADTSTPLAIRVDEPGANATWIEANGPRPADLTGEVEAVAMGVERLPAVNLVWASIPLIATGFAVRVATEP